MLIIPSQKAVIITPPRTGSTALRRAVLDTYKDAFSPYRHGERDMIPEPYRKYTVLGTFRLPEQRMRSLHRYMSEVSTQRNPFAPQCWRERMNFWGRHSFEDFIRLCQDPFSGPYNDYGDAVVHYATARPIPVTRKPQADYFRPDLGAVFVGHVSIIAGAVGVLAALKQVNTTEPRDQVDLSADTQGIFNAWHDCDLQQVRTMMRSTSHHPQRWAAKYEPKYMYMEGRYA